MAQSTPQPHLYETQTFIDGLKGIKPSITFDTEAWEGLARETLPANSWGYLSGNAGIGETYKKNIDAFRKWSILPSRLVQSDYPKLETTVLGHKLAYPVALAPIGVQKIFHRDGERAVAASAAEQKIPYILSTASCTSFEDAAVANGDGQRWYQLYWPANEHNEYTISLLQRAKASGYSTLFVTLDTYAMGWRPLDMDHGYNPFIGADDIGVELGLSDPVFQASFREKYAKEVREDLATAVKDWVSIPIPGVSHTWEDLEFLKQHWDGPIVLKGIQTVRDARRAVAAGVQGVVVSNHGGRQQDGVPAALDSLLEVVAAVGEQLDIFFDSGIRNGVDIAKALALGAKCVLIGRPYIYGLAINGKQGVDHVLKSLVGELEMTLHQAGLPSVDAEFLNAEVLRKEV